MVVTEQNGETRTVNFPGCYRVNLSFRLAKPIKNPYVEAFMQLGTNIPCQVSPRSNKSRRTAGGRTLPGVQYLHQHHTVQLVSTEQQRRGEKDAEGEEILVRLFLLPCSSVAFVISARL